MSDEQQAPESGTTREIAERIARAHVNWPQGYKAFARAVAAIDEALTSAQQRGSEQAWKDAIAAVPEVGVTFPQGYEEWIDAPSYRESVIETLRAAAICAAKQQ